MNGNRKQLKFLVKHTYIRLTQNTMFTNNILQLLLALVVFTTEASAADCVVEWDDGNVVATQLEGSWVINKELSLVLSPSSDGIVIDEIK